MCGIFGYHSIEKSSEGKKITQKLFKLSESRGKEASGIALLNKDTFKILKSPEPATFLIKTDDYHQ
jgi:glutamine phosphoribosylpyrophosphate amidotransferase